jgi:hypothetical protein
MHSSGGARPDSCSLGLVMTAHGGSIRGGTVARGGGCGRHVEAAHGLALLLAAPGLAVLLASPFSDGFFLLLFWT